MNIDDLKKLLAAATPGPWEVSERTKDLRPQVVSTEFGAICTMHILEVGDADPNAALKGWRAMTDALKALEDALRFYADPNRWPNMPNPENPHYDVEMDAGSVARSALSLLPTLRAALAPPADVAGDVEAIRARHEACGHIIEWPDFESFEAHNDRATLLHRVDALASELAAERERGERMREALNTIGNSLVCAPTDYAEHNASELLKAGNIARAALKEPGQ